MLADHLESPVTRRRLLDSIVAPHVEAFVHWLRRRGYSRSVINNRLRSLSAWAAWMAARGLALADAEVGIERLAAELAMGRVRHARGPNDDSRVAAEILMAFLREQGVIAAPAGQPPLVKRVPILAEFRRWTSQVRGLRDSSLDVYLGVIADLIARLGEDAGSYTAASLRAFVLDRAKSHGIWRAKSITTSVRAYLRFLAATGRCATTLVDAIPSYAGWKLSSIPRFLEPAEVENVLAACHAGTRGGTRDRAVMLLLARLGLRAGDVAGLRHDDLDWKNGRVAVAGKGRRREWLPLPQDVGDAILAYLRTDRPSISTTHVFALVNAPIGPLTRASVTHIARAALRRAGITAPINGAHLFRHSAATAMLRAGASLAGVGAVLRHRSPSTTAHYAKVDFALLAEIAQPWPEVPPC